MDGTSLFDLALDVDDLAVAEAGGGADAGGDAEGLVAKIDDGDAVDLAKLGALGVNEEGTPQDLFLEAFPQLAQAPAAGGDGTLDLDFADALKALPAGQVVGLPQ